MYIHNPNKNISFFHKINAMDELKKKIQVICSKLNISAPTKICKDAYVALQEPSYE